MQTYDEVHKPNGIMNTAACGKTEFEYKRGDDGVIRKSEKPIQVKLEFKKKRLLYFMRLPLIKFLHLDHNTPFETLDYWVNK